MPIQPVYNRRLFLRRGAATAGLVAGAGSLSALLGACGGDDDDTATTTTAGDGTSPSTTAAGGGELTTMSYQLSWLPTVEHAGTWLALENGYYTEGGLDVTPVPGGPNVATTANVVSGSALVGADGSDNVGQAVLEGAPLKVFGARLQKNPLCIMSLAESPITTPQELIGKTIGVAQGNQVPWQIFLALNEIDESEIDVVPVQFDPGPTANGEVEGQVVFSINEPAQLATQGIETTTMLFADFGYAIYAGCYFATEETIANQADVLAAFLGAERRGFEDVLADPALAAQLTVETYGADQGFDLDQQTNQAGLLETVMVTPATEAGGLLAMSEEDIAANVETLGVAGVEVTAEQLFTTEILDML
ncbi:MAG: ABC transporter substrate-binding protein [Actinomycetota bacterium]|nr:ABC transporter substrate-binding protein [Actinomycetota bacterium]